MTAQEIRTRLRRLANKEKAVTLQGFFKTGPHEYGEGDVFLGITVPKLRNLVKECDGIPITETATFLKSGIHEERLLALLILVRAFSKGDASARQKIYNFYCKNTRYINNWDLVDLSAPNIVGSYLLDKSRKTLYEFAKSRDFWKRRIAIMATFCFIKQNEFNEALIISKMLLADDHDLVHKAVGWMLREIGKRSLSVEEKFLKQHYKKMPRTMLRYAIERFPEEKRRRYLNGAV
ncbi:MAG TPA: DNA alkylation repair protein [Nitrospirota bacterium]|nr:DNA alkylation repair protein [Nitrospirota bacterium]